MLIRPPLVSHWHLEDSRILAPGQVCYTSFKYWGLILILIGSESDEWTRNLELVSMSIMRNDAGRGLFQVGKNSVTESTINAGNTPITINVQSDLATDGQVANGNRGYIANDSTVASPATLLVKIAHSTTDFMTQFTLAQGEVFDLTGWDISEIRLTRGTADCAFRVHAW